MVKFQCLCCGYEQEFNSAEEAYKAGWDVAPYFTIQPLCNLCPASSVAVSGLKAAQERHAKSHARWARDGRPNDFEWDQEQVLGGTKESFEEVKQKVEKMIGSLKH